MNNKIVVSMKILNLKFTKMSHNSILMTIKIMSSNNNLIIKMSIKGMINKLIKMIIKDTKKIIRVKNNKVFKMIRIMTI